MIKPLDFLFYIVGLVGIVLILISISLYFMGKKQKHEFIKYQDYRDSQNFFLVGIGLVVIVLVLIGVD